MLQGFGEYTPASQQHIIYTSLQSHRDADAGLPITQAVSTKQVSLPLNANARGYVSYRAGTREKAT